MKFQLLLKLVNWLEAEFRKAAEKYEAAAGDIADKIGNLERQRQAHVQTAKLADQLANKISINS